MKKTRQQTRGTSMNLLLVGAPSGAPSITDFSRRRISSLRARWLGFVTACATISMQANAQVIDYANGANNSSPIQITTDTTQLQTLGGVTATQSGVISEDVAGRPLEKIGAGTLILTAANTYTGTTTISAGTLQLGNGGTTGTVAGSIVDNGLVKFNYSGPVTAANFSFSSTGSVELVAGTLIVTGSSAVGGTVTIDNGATMQWGSGGGAGLLLARGLRAAMRS